jgi:hypothetical protein
VNAVVTFAASWRARLVSRGWGLLELRPMRLSLEEVFLQVTTEEAAPVPSDGNARVDASDADARVEGRLPMRNVLAIA